MGGFAEVGICIFLIVFIVWNFFSHGCLYVICLYIFSSWVQTELNDFALKKLAKRHGCPDPIRALIGKKYAFKK